MGRREMADVLIASGHQVPYLAVGYDYYKEAYEEFGVLRGLRGVANYLSHRNHKKFVEWCEAGLKHKDIHCA